jgi:micrococcal nuclease
MMSKKDKSDHFDTHIGSVSGPVHTGKGDILIEHWDARGITAADMDALRRLLGDLRARVATEAPPELAKEARKQVDKLEKAATAEKPDVSTMKQVRDWFLKQPARGRRGGDLAGQSFPGQGGRSGRRPGGGRDSQAVREAGVGYVKFVLTLLLLVVSLTSCVPAEPTRVGTGEYAQVAFVVDGDTIELLDGRRVRYIGVNAPETGRPYAAEALALNESLVARAEVWPETDIQESDVYGRLLAYVWVDDVLVNLELVRQGYANAYTVAPNGRYTDAFARAEEGAREAGRGMWTSADATVRITALHYDGPGSDRIAPNGEWVELTNEGSVPVDMDGYTLQNAGLDLYTFGEVVLPPGATVRVYSGRGSDTATELYWGLASEEVWHNDCDTAYLRDPTGLFVDHFSYTP